MRKLTIKFLFLMVNVWFALGWTPPSPITPPDTIPDAIARMNVGILGGSGTVTPGGSETLSFVAEQNGSGTGSSTTIATSGTLNVASGDTLIVGVGFDNPDGHTVTVTDGGSNSVTIENSGVAYGDGTNAGLVLGYILSAAANGTATFTATISAGREYRSISVMQFRKSGGTVSRVDLAAATGTGTAAQSGNISTAAGSVVVWGASRDYAASGVSNEQLGDVGATGIYESGTTDASFFYRILSESMTDGHAQSTVGSSAWACAIYAFKVE